MLQLKEETSRTAGVAGFDGFRLSDADFRVLHAAIGERKGDPREILPLIQVLAKQPPQSFASLAALQASLERAEPLSVRTIKVFWDLFLKAADRPIQRVYQRHLRDNPPPAGLSHEEKIAHLSGTREEAQAIVDGHDWDWLAAWLGLDRIGFDAGDCVTRLSNLAFQIRTVNFRFTYHCNISCAHCYNSSGPGRKHERLPLERMLAVIAQIPGTGLSRLTITGGEPFLYLDDVLGMIAAARAAGVRRISINSNAFWAGSEERARKILEQLIGAGFDPRGEDRLKISSGIYHSEFVRLDRIFALGRAYHGMFGRRLLVDFESARHRPDAQPAAMARFEAENMLDKIDLRFRNVTSMGRARDLTDLGSAGYRAPCLGIEEIVFDPDESVRPCCGLNNENEGVRVGRMDQHSLRELIKRSQNDPVLQLLASRPMDGIFPEFGKTARAEGYSGICDLCQDAIGDLRDKEPVQARLFASQRYYPFWFTRRQG